MASIRSKGNHSTEQKLRMMLVSNGISGWRLLPKGIVGNPDFIFPDISLAVFVDGCFWHGCPQCYHRPLSNRKYWDAKIKRNIERDKRLRAKLRRAGWSIIRTWEHELKDNPAKCIKKIRRKIQ
jgi:DNA mismatch endonuclease Vsr